LEVKSSAITFRVLGAQIGELVTSQDDFSLQQQLRYLEWAAIVLTAGIQFLWCRAVVDFDRLIAVSFLLLALSGVREKLVAGFPDPIKLGIQCGLGLFIAYIGLKNGGLVVSTARAPIAFATALEMAAPGEIIGGSPSPMTPRSRGPAARERSGFARRHVLRIDAPILPSVDEIRQGPRRPAFFVQIVRLKELLEQAQLVIGVEDGEIWSQAHELGVHPQDFRPD